MKGKEPHATGQSDQAVESGQQMPASKERDLFDEGKRAKKDPVK